MTDEIPERYQDQFCTIRHRVGSFNWADPSEESARVTVVLPEYDFKHEFKYDADFRDVSGQSWTSALYHIISERPRLLGDIDPWERLQDIYDEHYDEIEAAWEVHRADEIDEQIEQLREEKQSLTGEGDA